MSIFKKLTQSFLSVLLIIQSFVPGVVAMAESEETEDDMISITSDWKGTVFGDVGGQSNITSENFGIKEVNDSLVNMYVTNNRGKISGSTDGISYYYKEIPTDADFDFSVEAEVLDFNANNQVAFGIMLRDVVYENVNGNQYASEDYIAVGAVDQTMKAFTRFDGALDKSYTLNERNIDPAPGQNYDLRARKIGNNIVVSVGDEEQVFTNVDRDFKYIGLFVSRNAHINYSNKSLSTSQVNDSLTGLSVDDSAMKTDYLVNENLDLDGVQVMANYADGTEEVLEPSDYLVTGFDSSEVGTNTITFSYQNQTATLDLTIQALAVNDLRISYLPARLSYYIGDSFVRDGLVVEASYNNGEVARLSTDQYEVEVPEIFETAGTHTLTIRSTETPEQTTTFTVEVSEAAIEKVHVSQEPQRTQYFLGDTLDLTGLVVYAEYADGSRVRLLSDDYIVSELDTSSAGDKELIISYKGQEAVVSVNVKEKEVEGLVVTNYPKTTYTVGETFSPEGLVIAREFDNGDLEIVNEEDFELDVPTFNEAGTKTVRISLNDESMDPIELTVSVVEAEIYEFNEIIFGQSISSSRNFIEETEDGRIKLTALEGGGKVTGDHDGISFYYTELDAIEDNFELRATIEVEEYAKNPHDGQESFGIMARDAINTHLDSSVFSSNIAAVGGYSGGTRNPNGIQLFTRTGVLAPDGEGSEGITSQMLEQIDRPSGTYELVLKKTNSGFIGRVNNGEEEIIYEPEILSTMTDKMYVGFYAARLATITVSDIDLTVSKVQTDAPGVTPPAEAITPNFSVESLNRTSLENYDLRVRPVVDGTVTVRQGNTIIATDEPVEGGKEAVFNTVLTADHTPFSITFYPDDTQYLTSYNPIVQNFSVEKRSYEGDIIVSPEGRADGEGSLESPLDVETAIDFVQPGQRIILQEGVYDRVSPLEIKKHNNGEEGNMKTLIAADDAEEVVFDFGKVSEGGILSGDYWHIKGVDFRNSAGNTKGFTIGGNHNIIELAQFYNNGDTGLQISRTDRSDRIEDWPSYNLVLNVTSFDNRDPSNNNADGFGAKLTSGVGNVFRGAIAYNNIDDGWDLYTKVGSGKIGAVVIEDSIAYNNGFVSYDDNHRGDGNGFKLGGEGVHVEHVIKNSLTFGNLTYGLTTNSNPGLRAENVVGVNNGSGNFSFTTYNHIPTDFRIEGMASYQTEEEAARDSYPAQHESENNFFFDGSISRNASGVEITDENFESLDFENFEGFERDENGDIIWGPFLNFISPVEENDSEGDQEEDEPGEETPIDEENDDTDGNDGEQEPGEDKPEDKDDEGTPEDEEEQDSVELTIDTLRAGDSIITGNGPSGMTVYAWTGETLLGFTTINSPFEITLTEPLIEGMEVVIYGVDADGNQTEPMTLAVEAAESEDGDSEEGDSEELPEEQAEETEETDQDLESEEESEESESSEGDETKTKLPQTATATGLIGVLGMSTLFIGSVLKQFGKKKNNN